MNAIPAKTALIVLGTLTFSLMLACGDESSDSEGSTGGAGGSSSGGSSSGGSGVQISGGTNGNGTGGTSGGSAGSTFQECAATTQKADPTPANLLFVIDKSGSMNCNPPEGDVDLNAKCASFPVKEYPGEPSKWEVTRDALVGSLATLSALPNVSAGVSLFPNDSSCGVSNEPDLTLTALDDNGRADIEALLSEVEPDGETPIAGATILSYAHLAEKLRNYEIEGNTFVVLFTDGAETCKPSELPKLIGTDVPNAGLYDIRTFVIGAPGSEEARSILSQMAFEGGTAANPDCDHSDSAPDVGDCHFDMTTSTDFAADLEAALFQISQSKVLSCVFDVPQNPDGGQVDYAKVNVTFTPGDGAPETVLNDTAATTCEEAEGWQYSDDFTKIQLCGEVCDRVRADGSAQLQIVLGCPTEMVK